MSLTSFIKEPDVLRKFEETFPLPKVVNLVGALKATPITTNYPLIGTAFDYLLRFYIKNNPSAITKKWVAENSLDILKSLDLSNNQQINVEYISKIEYIINNSKAVYEYYLKTGNLNDELLKSTLLLAKIDQIYRSGNIDLNIDAIDNGDIIDLRNLINIVDKNKFSSTKHCLLNPTFGQASRLVGGADADIIIDDQLIDIKTTKFLTLKKEDFYQLIGYYILSKIGGIDDINESIEINNLSIYFSRYGVLFSLGIPSFNSKYMPISEDNFNNFVNWFIKRADKDNILKFG